MSMPRDLTVHGIGRLGITIQGQGPLEENSLEFTGLASAIHAGLSLLEKADGRQAMHSVGVTVVREWDRLGTFRFGGDVTQMSTYVDQFLHALRSDFPRVLLGSLGGPDVIAESRRIPGWDGNLLRYAPKKAGGIYYNMSKVSHMAAAARQANDSDSHGRKMTTRHRTYLFMLAVATAHELTHLFVGYLAQGHDTVVSYTPPAVSYLNYAGLNDMYGHMLTGESGRVLESRLFGGSIEFYRDISDDKDQAGIPYILDSDANAWKIDQNCLVQLVTRIEEFDTFPFATTGGALTFEDRQARGLLSLGAAGSQGGTFMRARQG
ncbi:hypothetical protein AK830_g4046 [Neonectria ditissima]|uniref:Uncharacterized protein n=1 Tax=Neonectria ditissima TaxID=78410 RepID=A0A0N8H7R5_9HYPO|nr:hypothetical protein AK830_g4046 [Neonectria ditissima]